jgi:dihydroorotate dehydrogenase
MLRDFVEKVGAIADGIAAINTIAAEIVDENGNQALPGEGRQRSGVCGHAIKWAGLEMVAKLKKLRAEFGYKYAIIGVGGVMKADDFFEYRNAGADIVMSATGAMWNPYLAKEIKERLR